MQRRPRLTSGIAWVKVSIVHKCLGRLLVLPYQGKGPWASSRCTATLVLDANFEDQDSLCV